MKQLLFMSPMFVGAFLFKSKGEIEICRGDTVYIYTPRKPHKCCEKNCFYKNQIIFNPKEYDKKEQWFQFVDLLHFEHPDWSFEKCRQIRDKQVNNIEL